MTITIRLEDGLDKELERIARARGVSKSAVVRECLADYLARHETGNLAWDLGKGRFGNVGSGRSDRSANRKQLLRKKFNGAKGAR